MGSGAHSRTGAGPGSAQTFSGGQGDSARPRHTSPPDKEWRFTWLCCFYWRRRNAIFSAVVLLDSLVKLACGYFVTSLQTFIEREGEQQAGGVSIYWVPILCMSSQGLTGHFLTPGPCPVPLSPESATWPASGRDGILSQVSRTLKPAFFFYFPLKATHHNS